MGLFFVGDLLNLRFAPTEALPAKVRFHLFWAGVLCLVTLLFTPYGTDYLAFLVDHLGHGRETPTMGIAEYTPTRDANHSPFFLMNLLLAGQAVFVLVLLARPSGRRFDWSVLLPNFFYMWLYVQFARTTFFWAPLFAMSCVYLLSERGSFLWGLIDGKMTAGDMAESFRTEFPAENDQVPERVATYLYQMVDNGLIHFVNFKE